MTTDQDTFELLHLTVDVDKFGTTTHKNSAGQWHRVHGPARVRDCGGVWSWCWHNLNHRVGDMATSGGDYYLFGRPFFTKDKYDLECSNKTNPLWK